MEDGSQKCIAQDAYMSDHSDDLVFSVGDVIKVIDMTDKDWWTGEANGKNGFLPSNLVKLQPKAVPVYNKSEVKAGKLRNVHAYQLLMVPHRPIMGFGGDSGKLQPHLLHG